MSEINKDYITKKYKIKKNQVIIIASKKNHVNVYGKTFHMTPSGKLLPLGAKQNAFTKCMSKELKGNLNTGEDLSKTKLDANKESFKLAVEACKVKKPKAKPKAPTK